MSTGRLLARAWTAVQKEDAGGRNQYFGCLRRPLASCVRSHDRKTLLPSVLRRVAEGAVVLEMSGSGYMHACLSIADQVCRVMMYAQKQHGVGGSCCTRLYL